MKVDDYIYKELEKHKEMVNELPLIEICENVRNIYSCLCDYFYINEFFINNYYVLVFEKDNRLSKINIKIKSNLNLNN